MAEKQYRMLRKNGKGTVYPWTEPLAARKDMVEVMMTAAEIAGKPIVPAEEDSVVGVPDEELSAEELAERERQAEITKRRLANLARAREAQAKKRLQDEEDLRQAQELEEDQTAKTDEESA